MAFAFTAIPASQITTLIILLGIHVFSGVSTAGINLALSNIGIKLAPKKEGIVYLTAKNMFVAFFSTLAPMVGGLMADFFTSHQLKRNIQIGGLNLHLLDYRAGTTFSSSAVY